MKYICRSVGELCDVSPFLLTMSALANYISLLPVVGCSITMMILRMSSS